MLRKAAPLIFGLCLTVDMSFADGEVISLAGSATTDWPQLPDEGKHEETRTQSSSLFQAAITLEGWTQHVQAGRGPLEGLVSRKLDAAEFHGELPGAADGECVMLWCNSAFDSKADVTEAVTVMKDANSWRVSGYFIR